MTIETMPKLLWILGCSIATRPVYAHGLSDGNVLALLFMLLGLVTFVLAIAAIIRGETSPMRALGLSATFVAILLLLWSTGTALVSVPGVFPSTSDNLRTYLPSLIGAAIFVWRLKRSSWLERREIGSEGRVRALSLVVIFVAVLLILWSVAFALLDSEAETFSSDPAVELAFLASVIGAAIFVWRLRGSSWLK